MLHSGPKKGKKIPASEGRCRVTLACKLTFLGPSVKSQDGGVGPWPRPGEKAVLALIQVPDVNDSPNNGINIGGGKREPGPSD